MSENTADDLTQNREQKALEALVADSANLEEVKALSNSFNFFEAIGILRQELHHSHFLAFLLNPQGNHGWRDIFVRTFLTSVLTKEQGKGRNVPVAPTELNTWNFDKTEVYRENQNIDILLVNREHHCVVLIENKIDTQEHSNQLWRYYELGKRLFPQYDIIALYLTPYGDLPSDDRYIPVGYSLVCAVLEELIANNTSALNSEMTIIIRHYTQMLRRHIVKDSEIDQFCRRVYAQHQQALNLIYKHNRNHLKRIRKLCEDLVKCTPGLLLDEATDQRICFIPTSWDIAALKVGQHWTASRRILLFCLNNSPGTLNLTLTVGPGSPKMRQNLFDTGQHDPFRKHPTLEDWFAIYYYPIIKHEQYGSPAEEIIQIIEEKWQNFLKHEFPQIDAVIKAQAWFIQPSQ